MKQKKILKFIVIFLIAFCITSPVLATQEEILQTQSETLNIKEFVSKANDYTKETFDGMDAGTLLNEAITGKIDNKTIFSKILNLFGKEVKQTIGIIR